MRLLSFTIKNFRGYRDEVTIDFDALTVFVGRNDIGKSTILEALDIFFNDAKAINPMDKSDLNKEALAQGDTEVVFTAVFDQLPDHIIIDETVQTTLADEMLLDTDGHLTVVKRYKMSAKQPSPSVFIKALHPSRPGCNDLLTQKITELKKRAKELTCEDRTKKSLLRQAIWTHYADDLQMTESEIDTTGDGMKDIWQKLERYMPIYSLFQSDRSNSDKDKEAQDPLKVALKEIFSDPDILDQLADVSAKVRARLQTVTAATLDKIAEMDPGVASTLNPSIPSVETLKWADVFKAVSITGDDDISINKRGSGVKRLILLNFFRARAERLMQETDHTDIIYAIEEPETSQHIHHQHMLIDAFRKIASSPHAQVVMTTHSGNVVKMMDFSNLRLIAQDEGGQKSVHRVTPMCLAFPSLNEINYSAFGEYSVEYHDELFGHLQTIAVDEDINNSSMDHFDAWLAAHGFAQSKTWQRVKRDGTMNSSPVTLPTYIRHKTHHPENHNNAAYTAEELREAIDGLRGIVVANG